jgi:DNA-binding NarL/FixJ family response regulator
MNPWRNWRPKKTLTSREIEVAALVWSGLTNREIADQIGTTEQVVKNYLGFVFDKVGVWSRLELALYVAANGGGAWRASLMKETTDRTSRPQSRLPAPLW